MGHGMSHDLPHHGPDDSPRPSQVIGLPPVEPPSGAFLMQLFVTPLVIVSLIVGIWFLVAWIAARDTVPATLVDDIERLNHRSWQKALTLANALRDPKRTDLRRDKVLAQRLATLLQDQLRKDQPSQEQLWLQVYLCRALGEFELPITAPTLVQAVNQATSGEQAAVRRAAIQALGMLASHLKSGALSQEGDVLLALTNATQPPQDSPQRQGDEAREAIRLRTTATYVLGLIGGEAATHRLLELQNDAQPEVRQNAAVGLARLGHEACVPPLLDMLAWRDAPHGQSTMTGSPIAVDHSPGTAVHAIETGTGDARWERELAVSGALRAVALLATRHPDFDVEPFVQPVDTLVADTDISPSLHQEAVDTQNLLQRRS